LREREKKRERERDNEHEKKKIILNYIKAKRETQRIGMIQE
jgi:hypothetical protein